MDSRRIRELYPTNCDWIDTDCQFSIPAIWRDGTGIAFVAESGEPSQDVAEDGLRQRNLDEFIRLGFDRADTTPLSLPVELKVLFSAKLEQLIDEPDDFARRGTKSVANRLQSH